MKLLLFISIFFATSVFGQPTNKTLTDQHTITVDRLKHIQHLSQVRTYKIISTPEMRSDSTQVAKNIKSLDSLNKYERPQLLLIDKRVQTYENNISRLREHWSTLLAIQERKARMGIK